VIWHGAGLFPLKTVTGSNLNLLIHAGYCK
jgi:hypothetical protein